MRRNTKPQPARQIGINDDWELPAAEPFPGPADSLPTSYTEQGSKRRKASGKVPPSHGSDEMMMMDFEDASPDAAAFNRAPGLGGPAHVGIQGRSRLGDVPDRGSSATQYGAFHQAPAQSPREQEFQLPPGLQDTPQPFSLPSGLPPAMFHHQPQQNAFSAVVEPPIRPIGGASIWRDDNTTFRTPPSLAAPIGAPFPDPVTSTMPPPPQPQKQLKVALSNPKSDIHAFYGKQQTANKTISAANYHTWHDGGLAHQLRWTSVFCCPNYGVLYHSIPFHGSPDDGPPVFANGSYWFSKKMTAEHAAAAHALDYQTGVNKLAAIDRLPDPQWDVPITTSVEDKAKIETQQNQFRIANGKPPLVRR